MKQKLKYKIVKRPCSECFGMGSIKEIEWGSCRECEETIICPKCNGRKYFSIPKRV